MVRVHRGGPGRRVAVALGILLLAALPPPAAAQAPALVFLLAYDELPGGERVPGVDAGTYGSGALRRLATGPTLDLARSPDGSHWAVLRPSRLAFTPGPGQDPSAEHDLEASSVVWRPDGGSVLATGSVHGEYGVWDLGPFGSISSLAIGQEILGGAPLAGGDALIAETVEGVPRTRTYVQGLEVRPYAIDPALVHANGTGFAEGAEDGVYLEDVHGAWRVLLDSDPSHQPIRLLGDTLVWQTETTWGVTRQGVPVSLGPVAHPFRVGAMAVDPLGTRAVAFVEEAGAWSLLHLRLDSGEVDLRLPHATPNLRAVAWGEVGALPPAPPPIPPPLGRDARAPERVAFVSAGGELAAGIWTARPDGGDLRLAYATPPGEPSPTALAAGRPGFLAFLLPRGLLHVRWDGSEPPVPLVNGSIRSFAVSPSGARVVFESEGPSGESELTLVDGPEFRNLGDGSGPSFHTEEWLRVVRRYGGPGLRTTLLDLDETRAFPRIDLVDAAVAPRAFAQDSTGFAYARDAHIYAADGAGARTVLRADGSAILAYEGRSLAYRTGEPGAYRLGAQRDGTATPLGPPAAALPAGTFTGNGTGLLVAFETAGVATLRWFPSVGSDQNVTWPVSPQGVRSLVPFAAFPRSDPGAPVVGAHSDLPPIGRAGVVWSGAHVYIFGGWNGSSASAGVYRWDPRNDTWKTMGATLPRPLYGMAAVADGKGAWLIGGTDGTTASDQILRYDGASDTIRAVGARLPSARAFAAAAWTGGAILIAGGEGASGPLGQILVYSPGTGQLQVRPVTMAPRAEAAAFFDGTSLVLAGGRGTTGALDSIVRVARDGTSVTPAASKLPSARDGAAAAWDGGAGYLFGDPEGDGRPLWYDPSADTLLRLTSRLPPRVGAAAVWTGARVALIGGYDGTAWTGSILLYEPAKDDLEVIPPPSGGNGGGSPGPGNGTGGGGNGTQNGGNDPGGNNGPGGNATDPGGNTTDPGGNTADPGGNTHGPGGNDGGGNSGGGNGTTNGTGNGTAPAPTTSVVLGQEAAPAPVRGLVTIAPRTGGSYSVRATSAGGQALTLGEGKGDQGVTWDTTRTRNGRYTVTAYDENGTELATSEIIVQNPRSTPTELVVASATGVAVTVGLSALWGHLVNLFGALKGWVLQLGEEEFKDKWRDRAAIGFSLQSGPLWKAGLAMGAMAGVLGISSAYSEASNPKFAWGEFLTLLPFVAGTVGVFYAASLIFDHIYARHIGRESEFRIWAPGTAALTASTALFATPFGVPGFVEGSETEDRRLEGRRGLASYLVLLTLTLPFAAAYLWRFDVYETGVSTVLMLAVNAAVPIRRLPGALVWRWNKVVWAVVTALAFALFAVSELALGTPVIFAAVGAAGALGIVGVFVSHRLLPEGYLEGRRAAVVERAAERAEAEDALQDVAQAAAAGVGPGADEPPPPERPEGPR